MVRQRADEWGQIGPPKSAAGRREIPLAPAVLNALREWKLACPKGQLGLVFPTRTGAPIRHSNIAGRHWCPLQRRVLGEVRFGLLDFPPWSGGVRSERHAAARMVIPSMLARASAGVR